MSAPTLHPYQAELIDKVYRATDSESHKRILVTLPTGAGKTVVAAAIARAEVECGKRVAFISHRREITRQTVAKMHAAGLDGGIIQAGFPSRPDQATQICSIQTLTARGLRPPADIVFIDEAHHARAHTYEQVVASYPNATVIGMTATPCRKDGRGLGNIFTALVEGPQVQELIDGGYLVPSIVYAPTIPDLTGVRTQAGDYNELQLAERMDRPQLVGGVVEHWLRHGERRKTVAFAVNVAHSIHLRDEFVKAGVKAEHLDGSTPTEDRDAILERLANGDTEVVCNCAVLVEGWDSPGVSCLIMARPTKSLGLFRQMGGRGLRTAPGKKNCIVLDHAGAVYRHGLFEDPIEWSLDIDQKSRNRRQEARETALGKRLCECPRCKALRTAGEACHACGWEPQRRAEAVDVIDGNLARLDRQRRPQINQPSEAEKRLWYGALWHIGNERARQRPFNAKGWSRNKFREKFGDYPPWSWHPPLPVQPSAEVRAWVRSRDIAFAKTQAKQRGAA